MYLNNAVWRGPLEGKLQLSLAKIIKLFFFAGLCILPIHSQSTSGQPAHLHRPYDILLQIYVKGDHFNYARLHRNSADMRRLDDYLQTLQSVDPSLLAEKDALAFWINLYNAATLQLVLTHYPVKSIKDIKHPWKRKLVTIAGRPLSLDEIENEIIRPQFKDARVHFALNCASLGCPPLSRRAYTGERLDEQLDEAARRVITREEWVRISEKEIKISKLFQWYEEDFVMYAGSVREFLVKYREEDRPILMDEKRKIKYLKYDWKLNDIRL